MEEKTGTSKNLRMENILKKKVITSFIGTFPIDNPKYLTFVLFDEPRRNTSESLENFEVILLHQHFQEL